MELATYFRSIVEQDLCAVVICNLQHEIIYMNPAAVSRYAKWGGDKLIGKSLLDCHNTQSQERIREVVGWFQESTEHNRIYTFYNEKENKDVYMVALRKKYEINAEYIRFVLTIYGAKNDCQGRGLHL